MALLIDKPILELLDISEHTQLRITTDGDKIVIEPLRNAISEKISDNESIQKAYERIVEKYKDAFQALAKK
ncbi:AbrB/MazE/SpoVT family DNA-binding domain-containing protein [Candidatus Dependentiae bacterium]|nr:AbrB/MazE/SpoVT family DNA-binding domain-containing protein [Candidatus Dependentiae bacterium]